MNIWRAESGTASVLSVMDFPGDLLPGGLQHLDLVILDEPSDGTLLGVVGYDGSHAECFGSVPFPMPLNPAKTICYFAFGDNTVIVSSEYSGSAARENASYRWDGTSELLVLVDAWTSDWSLSLLEAVDSLLALGEIEQAADSVDMIMYGWNYYESSELCCRFLRAAHGASMAARDEGLDQRALDIYDEVLDAFEVIQYDADWFLSFGSLEEYQASEYSSYMGAEELSTILKDYADLLGDQHIAAESVLENAARSLEGDD